jgi:hypothetical protein
MTITLLPAASGGKQPLAAITFDSWVGRPQKPKDIISLATRLGGTKLIIQKMNNSSPQTASLATKGFVGASQNAVNLAAQAWIDKLPTLVGVPSKWTDETGVIISKVVVVDYTVTLSAKSGGASAFGALATIQFTTVVDEQ